MMCVNPKAMVLEKENAMSWYVVPKALLSAKTFVNKATGEIVQLNMIDKLVLVHLIDMVSFHNSEGRTMHESMAVIADAIDASAKSVSRSVSKWIEHGVVSATLVSKVKGYTYHAIDVFQDWNRGDMTEGNKARMGNPINQTKVPFNPPTAPQEAFADLTPDDGMPEHLQAPQWDYSDVFSQMADSDYEPRIGVMNTDDVYGDEFLQSAGY